MNVHFQLASERDLLRLLELMRELYQHEAMNFDEEVARSALKKTLLDSTLGSAYLILLDEQPAGYFVLTFCFSLEFHGKFALLDEIYVRKALRKQKMGTKVIEFVEGICKKMGIKALRLEVGEENQAAQSLYGATGFQKDPRYLFTKWL
ncbi:MAG: GNAT family N-acetyltransferase [Candidatus Angelobacter sp. Gp1-AA117]|nr:MAG: GNAT family N-acetyltransferase [Candidatus Angelobacter sp. Gp1-AA117]